MRRAVEALSEILPGRVSVGAERPTACALDLAALTGVGSVSVRGAVYETAASDPKGPDSPTTAKMM